ncbi:transglutaminase family protein [Phycisphaera mikurensis]|uniref:Transglutaminase-like domain-containing protein n=1 Tax=Phycisphaera mikurensis (strain NBRC 102666 / KCTC 22515 / FYK2301M01) TaxID=1142394 RepID=I0IBX5_PHYMF|nr:transglutaminase family protein [Phycisphaera mikurensis]MBB6442013.1 transglutaminase-like putative cysteine protease [Phycisphaera mikurensis]BAM02763.1 hypothetical protein PSMK_06040 [Phycisphaera mikurensis NBRC 102666]
MQYTITHRNTFTYDKPVRESVMELRMKPRDEWHQRLRAFDLWVSPRVQLKTFSDWLGNAVHHFTLPNVHVEQVIEAESHVVVDEPTPLPSEEQARGEAFGWEKLHGLVGEDNEGQFLWDMLQGSHFAHRTAALTAFADGALPARPASPLEAIATLCRAVHEGFTYRTASTTADSPIDEALESRAGVCQDFAHVLIAAARHHGLPCRYVSGYLHGEAAAADVADLAATHAWVECFLPGYGWAGFDPTSGTACGAHHIRTAIGRDYADVPPTKGVFRGSAASSLRVSVHVASLHETPRTSSRPRSGWIPPDKPQSIPDEPLPFSYQSQQMQQQQ